MQRAIFNFPPLNEANEQVSLTGVRKLLHGGTKLYSQTRPESVFVSSRDGMGVAFFNFPSVNRAKGGQCDMENVFSGVVYDSLVLICWPPVSVRLSRGF